MTTIIRRRMKSNSTSNDVSYWEKIHGGIDACFVCDKKFKSHHKKIYIGRHKESGEPLFRHNYCEAGSSNWTEKFGGRIIVVNKSNSKAKDSLVKIKPESQTTIKRGKKI